MTFLFSSDVAPPVLEPEAVRQHYAAEIEVALTRKLYRGSRLPSLLVLLSGLTGAGLLWGQLPGGLLLALLAWLGLLVGLRLRQAGAFLRASAERQGEPHWRRRFLLGASASGLTLALLGGFGLPLLDHLQQAVLFSLMAAATLCASVAYAANLRALFACAIPALLPSSLYLLGHADNSLQGWGLCGLVLLATVLVNACQVHHSAQRNLLRHFQNQSLLAFQEQAHRASSQMNRELAHEVRQRQQVEQELRAAQRALEQRVSERTQALSASEQALRAEEARRHYQASHDELTGLANRSLLLQQVEEAARRARPHGQRLALLHLDLDRFELLNASLGLRAADDILCEMARRLRSSVRQADLIARVGVDEFAILLDGPLSSEELESLSRRLLAELRRALLADGHELLVSASLGIALFEAGSEPASLLNQASMAMRHAKQLGGNNVQFYRDNLQGSSRERLLLEAQLERALQLGQLEVYYQPRLSLGSERLHGAEALVRWHHPQFGLMSPGSFIKLAEETGQITAIGDFVLAQACRQARRWQQGGLDELCVSVNISMHQLRQEDFVSRIAAVLAETGLPARLLELELTESQLSDSVEELAGLFRELRSLGVRLAIDDFGTGYSSLSYLKHLPVDVVKIDQTFIRELDGSGLGGDAAITRAIIVMAHSLGLEVVAEGVEQPAQLDFLRENGCDEIQGYLIGRPMPAGQLSERLQAQTQAEATTQPRGCAMA